MKNLLLLMALVTAYAAPAQQVIHDKDAELRAVNDFDAIDVSNAIELRLSTGSENKVVVSASNAENREGIRTEVRGSVLRISYSPKKFFRSSGKPTVYVSAKKLREIRASGACDVIVSGDLKYEELHIDLSGASDFKGSLNGHSLSVELSGASDMTVKGANKDAKIDASGASHFRGFGFKTENCKVEASGASDIKITVNKVLSASASGASRIAYQGEGTIENIHTSGAGRVSKGG